ncbi:hypothetical protein [Pseudarthrobacter chlorophenolicus]|uniref:hypothetical protein n=1 Tax=Pseudarthrobacter chlorophenolicus TaxID=85085 RepID=UPI0005F2F22E|nr:hypothetical protein [Pseudarthrobacter chlorophenolicus]
MDIALWTALISGLVAIGAGYLGALWGSRNEHRQWLRNERLKAYASFPEETGIANYGSILDASMVTPEAIARQRAAMHRLQLFAPDHICERAVEALATAKTFSRAIRDGAFKDGMEMDYAKQLAELSYVMRVDLHRPEKKIVKASQVPKKRD